MNLKNKTVLFLYRRTLYSLMDVFRGDYVTFHTTRITIRREIEKRRDLTDPKEIREKILDLEEARNTISTSIMQVNINIFLILSLCYRVNYKIMDIIALKQEMIT